MVKGPPLSKPRRLYRVAGMGPNVRYGVHDHSLGNVRRGLVERVFMVEVGGTLQPTPQPTPGSFNQLRRFSERLLKVLPRTTRCTTDEFLSFYSGRKRETYEKAARSLEVLPIRARDAWLKTFVKAEKLNISAKPDPAPRVIQPRDPRYNIEVGRYLRPAEELLFRGIDRVFGGRTVFKGINADTAGKEMASIWNSFRNPVAIGMDASRFDQHISVDALKFEHGVWLQMFPLCERPLLRKLLSWQLKNRGLARCPDGSVRYEVNGCRMSGDMNTSSGNCLIMCATVHNWCTKNGITHFRLANNGDDCVLFVERTDEAKATTGLIEYYRTLGFTMKVEKPVYVLEHVEFCQTRPVVVGEEYRMVRNLHHSLSKDLHSLLDLSNQRNLESWVRAMGDGGRALNDGVPVMSAFFAKWPRLELKSKGVSDKVRMEFLQPHKMRRTLYAGIPISDASRFSFWLAFGLTPDEQVALELGFPTLPYNHVNGDMVEQPNLIHFSRV